MMAGCGGNGEGDTAMQDELRQIEKVRAEYESQLMNIDGVVSVSIGTGESGKPVLKIGTSVPPEQVRAKLPEQLLEASAELEFVGDIRAQ